MIDVVRRYLHAVRAAGLDAKRAVLFGSHVRGQAGEWSDIDLVVLAPELDGPVDPRLVEKLWEARAFTDSRIDPVPCGEREWETDTSRPILEIARREGVVVTAALEGAAGFPEELEEGSRGPRAGGGER